MATRSSTLAQKIPWTEEPGAGYCPWGCKESDTASLVAINLILKKKYFSALQLGIFIAQIFAF